MTERPLSSIQKRRTRGAIYVEVLVAIIPVLVFFFGLLQLAMLYSAKLIVRHAAWRAARSAVVILDDDPEKFSGVERGVVTYQEAGSAQGGGGMEQLLEGIGEVLDIHLPMSQLRGLSRSEAGPRLSAIKQAANMPLAVLAPMPGALMRALGMNGDELGEISNSTRFLLGMFLYNRAAAMVTLRDAEGVVLGGENNRVPSTANITVRVTYLYYCGMPIVNYFMCDSLMKLSGLDQLDNAVQGYYETVSHEGVDDLTSGQGTRAIDQAGRDLKTDLQSIADRVGGLSGELQYAETPELLLPLVFSRAHFKMVSAEATMPNQGACYYAGSSCFAADRIEETDEGGDE